MPGTVAISNHLCHHSVPKLLASMLLTFACHSADLLARRHYKCKYSANRQPVHMLHLTRIVTVKYQRYFSMRAQAAPAAGEACTGEGPGSRGCAHAIAAGGRHGRGHRALRPHPVQHKRQQAPESHLRAPHSHLMRCPVLSHLGRAISSVEPNFKRRGRIR